MTFSYTVIRQQGVVGHKREPYGTFSNNNNSTGGTINTGLHLVEHFQLQYTGDAAVAEAPSVNETLPTDGTIIIITTANKNGLWKAVGL